MKSVYCHNCTNELCNDEIALNLKLLGKHIGTFQCYHCLSKYIGSDITKLQSMSEYYRSSGCILFQTSYIGKEI
jgi:hypothetical protein